MKKKSPDPKVQHRVPNNPEYDRQTRDPQEVAAERQVIKSTLYDASSYRTHAGHWKRSDEPDEAEQFRQSDRINQVLKAQRQKASRERLKQKGAVPTRNGKKLFDEFMKEASACRTQIDTRPMKVMTRDFDALQNLYDYASAIESED
jgi:Ulp1 family protease